MDLGTLLLTINLSTDELYRGLDRAKTQVAAAGREMETTLNRRVDSINQSLKLVTQVDDTALTNLNKHLDLKVKHVQQVNRYLKSNPVTPTSDTSDIDQAFLKLNQFRKAYQEVNAYVRNNPIVIGTDNGGIDESVGRLNEIPKAVSKINQRLKSNPVKLSTNTIELDQTEQKLNRYEHRIKSLRRTSIAVGVKDSIPLAARTAADSATAAKNLSEGKPFYAAAEAYKQANAKTPQSKIIVKSGNPTGGAIATVLVDRTLGPIIEQAVKTGMQVGSQYLSDKLKSHPIAKTLGLDKAFADIAKVKQTEQLKSAAPPPQTPERREKSATPQPVKVVQQDNRQRSNLLGTPLRFLSAPARQTLGGFYSGIGYAYGSRFGEGSLEGLQKRTGLDLKKAGSNAVGATGYLAGVGNLELLVKSIGNIQDIENTVQPVLKKYGLGQDQRFNVNKAADAAFGSVKGGLGAVVPILDKSLDADRIQTDIADTKEALAELTLALVKLDNVAGKAKNLRDLTGKMAKYPSEAVIATYKKSARESARNLEQRLQEPAAPAQPLPEGTRKVALVSGGFAAAGGKSGHKVAASLSPFMAEGTHVVPFENREFDVAKDAATDGFVAWAADVVQQVAKVLDKGYNPASVRMATEALAYKKANPDVELDLIGYSAGGLIAREAQEILKELQVEANVLTLGTPNVGAFASVSERSASVFGAGDPLKYLSANRLKDLEGVKGHGFDMYETDKQLQSIIQRFSAEGVTPELVEELRALQKTTQEQVAQTRAANTQVKAQQQKAATTKQPVAVSQPTQITGDPQQLALKARALMLSQQARNILPGFDPKAYGKSASAAATNQKQAEQALADLAKLDLSTELSVEHVNTLRQAITRLTALANRVGETAVPALDELSKLPVEELQRLVNTNMASDQAQQISQLQQHLQTFTRKDLQTIAKQSGATGYSKLNKSDLVNLLAKNVNTSSQLAKEQDALKQIRKAEESLIALSRKAKATTDPAKQEQMNVELRTSVLSLIDKVNDALQVTQHGENRQYIGGVKGRLEQQYLRSFNMSESSIEQMRKRLQQGQGQPQGGEARSGVDDIGLARILPGVKQAYQPDSIGFVKNTIDGIKGLFSKAKGSLNEALNIQSGAGVRANLRNVAKSPIVNDLVVNTAGFAASRAAAHYGVVPELGADLTAALATRQALNAGRAVAGSYSSLRKDDAFQAANALQKFTMVVIASTQRFQSAGFQKRMGEELTGDLTGFTIGNITAMAANAVPAFAPVPFKGAAAAMATVPKLVQMRDRHLKGDSDESKLDETGLARILPKVPIPAASKSFLSAARSALNGMKGLSKIFNDTQSIAQRRYEEIAKETAKLSGVKLDDRHIPKMVVDSKRLKEMGVGAFYDIQKNQVIISKEVENILKDAQNLEDFSEEIKTVVHELRHSLQLKGGKISLSKVAKGRQQFGVDMADPGTASLEAIENADKSVEAIRREALKRNGYRITGAEERTIRRAEIDAYQFEQNTPRIAQSVQQALDSEMQAKMQATAKSMIDSVDEIAQAFEQVFPGLGRYTQVFGQRLSSLGSIAGSVVTTFVSFKVLQGLIGLFRTISNGALEAARSMEKFAITIEFSKGGQAKGVEGLAFVREQVQAMGGDFQSAARGYTQVSAAARGTSLEGYEADQIFKAFEQAASVYQLDAPSKDRLFTAVQQIMSKETISSEELKQQIGEVLPGFMQTVARSRGETVSEVTRALQGGELTSTKDLPKIAQQLTAETSGGLTKSLESSQAAVNRFNTSVFEFKSLMGKPLVFVEKLGLNTLASVLGSVQEHADFVVKAFLILGGMAIYKLLEGLVGLTSAMYGFLAQLGLVPPLAVAGRAALTALKTALIEIAGNFALIYAGITLAQVAFELFSDRSGELGKNARASSAGIDALTESLNRAADAGQNLSDKTKNLTATGLIGEIAETNRNDGLMGQQSAFAEAQQKGLLSGDSLRRIPLIGGAAAAAADFLNADLIEVVNQQAVDRQLKAYEESVAQSSENVKKLIEQAEGFTGGQTSDAIENLKRIDQQIEENQTKQRTLRIQDPGNTDELKKLQAEAEQLNIERGKYAGESGALQQELQATLDRRKQDLETLNGLLKNNNIDQETYNKLAKQTTADIQNIENAQTQLNQKIGEGSQKLAEFNKNIKQIAAELADAKENAEINVNLRRTETARSELARGYTPGQSQAVGDQINIKGLQEQIDATTAAISRYESQIANSNAGRTLELMGIEDPTSLGTAQIQNLKELYQGNAQETAALDAIEKLRQARIDTTGLTAQLAEAQVQAQRSIVEAQRQVVEFIRGIGRNIEDIQLTIKQANLAAQIQNTKNEIKGALNGFTDRFFGGFIDGILGMIDLLNEPLRNLQDYEQKVLTGRRGIQDAQGNYNQLGRSTYGAGGAATGGSATFATGTLAAQEFGAPRSYGGHAGQDIDISGNDQFRSVLGGTVSNIYSVDGYDGQFVEIQTGIQGVVELIAEGRDTLVRIGDSVAPGQVVQQGEANSGVIHYQINVDGAPVDPIAFLEEQGLASRSGGQVTFNYSGMPGMSGASASSGSPLRRESRPAAEGNYRVGRDTPINQVVLHETVGSAESTINAFQTPGYEASYHAMIRRDGSVVDFVNPQNTAYGAYGANEGSVHYSLESPEDGRGNEASHSGYTEAQYQSLAALIHQEGFSSLPITTHREVDTTGERFDPRSFDTQRFQGYMGSSAPIGVTTHEGDHGHDHGHDHGESSSSVSQSFSSVGGADPQKIGQAMAYYLSQGLTPQGASYLVGNLIQESGLDPQKPGDGGQALGIAQWHPDRRYDMPSDYQGQLEFSLREMERDSPDSLAALRNPNASTQEIQSALQNWERYGVEGYRYQFGAELYSQLQNGASGSMTGGGQVDLSGATSSLNQYSAAVGQQEEAFLAEMESRNAAAAIEFRQQMEKRKQELAQAQRESDDETRNYTQRRQDIVLESFGSTSAGQTVGELTRVQRDSDSTLRQQALLIEQTEGSLENIKAMRDRIASDPELAEFRDLLPQMDESIAAFEGNLQEVKSLYEQESQLQEQRIQRTLEQRQRQRNAETTQLRSQNEDLQVRQQLGGIRDSNIQSILQSRLEMRGIDNNYAQQITQVEQEIADTVRGIQALEAEAAQGIDVELELQEANADLDHLTEKWDYLKENRDLELSIAVNQRNRMLDQLFYDVQGQRVDAEASLLEGRGDIYGAATLRQSAAELNENRRSSDQMSDIDALAATGQYDPVYIARLREEAELLTQVNLENIDRQFMDLGETLSQVGQNALGGFLEDLLTGKNALESLKSALSGLASQLAQMAVQQLFAGIFGGGGGGGLGGLLGGAPTMAPAGGGGGLTTALGIAQTAMSFFGGGGMGGLMGFKEGGVVEATNHSGYREGYGKISEALAREGANAVLAALTPGERVLTVEESQEYERLQQMGALNFKRGGVVGDRKFTTPQMQMPSSNINVPINVNVEGGGQGKDGKDSGVDSRKLEDNLRGVVIREIQSQMRPGGALYNR